MKALTKTDFHFDGQKSVYHGKVRDVYDINDDVIFRRESFLMETNPSFGWLMNTSGAFPKTSQWRITSG